jgi:hypothetical protein
MNRMIEEPPVKRRPGRPPKQGELKRAPFQTRMRGSLRQRLEESATANGRSLSEEIEIRLEASYDSPIESLFGGRAGFTMANWLYASFKFAGDQLARIHDHPEWTPDQWLFDRGCFEGALMALVEAVWVRHPEPVTPEDYYNLLKRLYGRRLGRELTDQYNARADQQGEQADLPRVIEKREDGSMLVELPADLLSWMQRNVA